MADAKDFPPAHGKQRALGRCAACPDTPSFDALNAAATSALAVPSGRDERGRFVGGNTVSRCRPARRAARPSRSAAIRELEAAAPAVVRAVRRWAREYSTHRRGELAKAFGEISSAVCLLVDCAAQKRADARLARLQGDAMMKAAAQGGHASATVASTHASAELVGVELQPAKKVVQRFDPHALYMQAAQLERMAAGDERDSWALAALEAKARPLGPEAYPWLVQVSDDDGGDSG
jgi:hypothetical protein